jgi:hypothetical protein
MKVLDFNNFVNEAIVDSLSYKQRLFSVVSSAMYEAESEMTLHPEKYPDAESVLKDIKRNATTRYRVMMYGLDNIPTENEFWEFFSKKVNDIFDFTK